MRKSAMFHGDSSRDNKFWVYRNSSATLQNPRWDTRNPDNLCDNHEYLSRGTPGQGGESCLEYRCLGHDKLYHGDRSRSNSIWVHPRGVRLQNSWDCYSLEDLGCDNWVEVGQEGEIRCFRCQGHVAETDEMVTGYSVSEVATVKMSAFDIPKRQEMIPGTVFKGPSQSGWTRDLTQMIQNEDSRLTQKLTEVIMTNPGEWFKSQSFSARAARQPAGPDFNTSLATTRMKLMTHKLESTEIQQIQIEWNVFHKGFVNLKQRQKRRRMDVFMIVFKVKFPQVRVSRDVDDRGEDVLKLRLPGDFNERNTFIVKSVLGLNDVQENVDIIEAPVMPPIDRSALASALQRDRIVKTVELCNIPCCADWYLAHRRSEKSTSLIIICSSGKANEFQGRWDFAKFGDDDTVVPAEFVNCVEDSQKMSTDVAMTVPLPEGVKIPQLNKRKFMEAHPSVINMRMAYNPDVSANFEAVVSVPALDWTPSFENNIPPVIDGYPTRVVAGWSQPCCGLHQSDKLMPGLVIGAADLESFGTIGGFIRFNGLFYIVTCHHVMCAKATDSTTVCAVGTRVMHSTAPVLHAIGSRAQPMHIGHYIGGMQDPEFGDVALIELLPDLDLPCFFQSLNVSFDGLTPPELVFDIGVYGQQLFAFTVMIDENCILQCPMPVVGRGAGAVSPGHVKCPSFDASFYNDRLIGALLKGEEGMTTGDSGMLFWTANFERQPDGLLLYRREVDDKEKLPVGMGCKRFEEHGHTTISLILPIRKVIDTCVTILTEFALDGWMNM